MKIIQASISSSCGHINPLFSSVHIFIRTVLLILPPGRALPKLALHYDLLYVVSITAYTSDFLFIFKYPGSLPRFSVFAHINAPKFTQERLEKHVNISLLMPAVDSSLDLISCLFCIVLPSDDDSEGGRNPV